MLDWLKGAAFIILCLSTMFTVVTVGKHVSNTLMAMDESIDKLNTEIDELHRFTLEAALTASEARKASIKESQYLDTWNSEISQTLTTANDTLLSARTTIVGLNGVTTAAVGTLGSATTTLQSLQAPISQANGDLEALQPVILHIDGAVSNQDIQATWTNIANTTAHLDATAQDIQEQVHKWTHPGIWTKVKGFALDVAHVFNPL